METPTALPLRAVRGAALLVGRGARRLGRIGLGAFDLVLGGPGRVTEIDTHNAFNPYSASYDPESRRLSSGRRR